MPPSSSPKSTRSTNYRTPKWRNSQFISLSGQPATGVSKVFAQPLQGSPLPSALNGLPPIVVPEDSRSIFSVDERKKREEGVEERGVQVDSSGQPEQAEDEPPSEALLKGSQMALNVQSETADSGDHPASSDATGCATLIDAPLPIQPVAITTESPSLLPQTIGIHTSSPSQGSAQIPSSLPLTSPRPDGAADATSPSPRRSWFSSLSRSRGTGSTTVLTTDSVALQPTEEHSKAAVSLVEVAGSSNPTPDATGHYGMTAEPAGLSSTLFSTTTESTMPLTTSSSIDDVVPPPVSTPEVLQGALDEKKLEIKETLQERERASSISSMNPSMSRFVLRIPLLGRPKVPLEQAGQRASTEPDANLSKGSSSLSEAVPVQDTMVAIARANQAESFQVATLNIPEVKLVLPSPPSSSDALAEAVTKPSESAIAKPLKDSSLNDIADKSQTEPLMTSSTSEAKITTPVVASSSSWWNYLSWSGSVAAGALPPSDGGRVENSDSAQSGLAEEAMDTNRTSEHPGPVQHDEPQVVSDASHVTVSAPSPPLVETGGKLEIADVPSSSDKDQAVNPLTDSDPLLSSKSQELAWYSPWAWYASSPVVQQTSNPSSDAKTDATHEPSSTADDSHAKSESEIVKEQAPAHADDPSVSIPEAPNVQTEAGPSQKEELTPKTSPFSTSISTNPIESTISSQRSGWVSFFTSKALLTRVVWDNDEKKIKDRPEDSGMEVMTIGDDEEDAQLVHEGQTKPVASSPCPIDVASKVSKSPIQSVTSSPRPDVPPPPPKEREPKKLGPPALPLTNSEALKTEATKRQPSPSPSTTKKVVSGTSTPRLRATPPNLVLPTWQDVFLSPPRSTVLPLPTPPATQRGTLGKTLEFMSGMFFPDVRKDKGKGKERERGRARSLERSSKTYDGDELLTFGSELPKALDVIGESLSVEGLHERCRVIIIGVAGWSPGAVTRTLAGGLPSSSSKFVDMMCSALEKFEEQHNFKFKKITRVPLEGDGTVERKASKVYSHLLGNEGWLEDLHLADVIFVASHSQGCIVATHLVSKLIHDGHIITPRNVDILANATSAISPGGSLSSLTTRTQKICCLELCGIHLGPLRYMKTSSLLQPYIQYFENESARELFQFQNTETQVSKDYTQALRTVMDHGAKMVYVASLNDQVVPIYSGLFVAASHPRILRALYIDGDAYHSSDFLSNLLVLLIRIMNSGLSDSGLLAHLSEATAGTLSGVGHSTAYEELATYSLAVDYLFLATDGADVRSDLSIETFDAVVEQNDYEIPWSLRDLIADERVAHFFAREFAQLRDAFDGWSPKTSILRDVKRKLQPIQRLSSIRGGTYSSRL